MNKLEQIRIVMVNTSDSGNIGSAARAMKTMGLTDLCLVAPQEPHDSAKSIARASGAAEIVCSARVVATLDEALADCHLIVGASARMRTLPWPLLHPPAMARLVRASSPDTRVAVLFGREASGLSNEELQRCHYHVTIPGNPEYCVLNVSQAIQVICYQLRQTLVEPADDGADLQAVAMSEWDAPLADDAEMERFFEHFRTVLLELEFFDPNNPKQLFARIRRLFNRARPDRVEVNVLRGILTAIQKRLRVPSQ